MNDGKRTETCPFCGGTVMIENYDVHNSHERWVFCIKCHAHTITENGFDDGAVRRSWEKYDRGEFKQEPPEGWYYIKESNIQTEGAPQWAGRKKSEE